MPKDKLSRRHFLRVAAMSAAGAGLIACQPQTVVVKETVEVEKVVKETVQVEVEKEVTKVVEKEVTKVVEKEKVVEVVGVSENQAPELQQLVKDGKLPPLDERLPKSPKVLTQSRNEVPQGELEFTVGQYGGTIRTVQPAPEWQPDLFVGCDEPLCAAPGILGDGIGGGVAEGFTVSEGGKVFTFRLRPGMKWSDGEPITTDDVRFTYEDFLSNTDITPTFPRWMKSGNVASGTPLVVEVLDDYTFTVSFPEPYAGFPAWLAILTWKGYTELVKPMHYLTQFHTGYTKLEDLEAMIKEESLGEGEWWTLFNLKDITNWELCSRRSIGFPNCQPWYTVEVEPTYTKYNRNPYYFKVDEEGQQLPYINDLYSAVVQDVNMSQLKVIAGEVDFLREDATIDNLALYNENADKGGYRIQLLKMHVSPTDVCINQTIDDDTWRLVVQDVRFRRALSLATDRETLIDAIYYGYAELPELSPSDYDPDEAERLLDEMGMTERGADGFRLAPNGQPFEIPFEVSMDASDIVPVTELIVENYKEVGINASMKVLEGTLRNERETSNELRARVRWHHFPELWWGALWDANPYSWGNLWDDWFNNPETGEEPPEDVKEFMRLRDLSIVVDGQDREDAIAGWKKMMYDNVYVIVTVEKVAYPLVVNKNLRNVPTSGFAISANFSLEQMYYEA